MTGQFVVIRKRFSFHDNFVTRGPSGFFFLSHFCHLSLCRKLFYFCHLSVSFLFEADASLFSSSDLGGDTCSELRNIAATTIISVGGDGCSNDFDDLKRRLRAQLEWYFSR